MTLLELARQPAAVGRIVTAFVLVSLLVLGLAQPADGKPWRKLRRPLHLPQVTAGETCPVSPVNQRVDWERHSFFGSPGIGPGPVYLGLGSPPRGHMAATQGPSIDGNGRPWFGTKVFWYVKPAYHKRVLIRGRRLDGSGAVAFADDDAKRPGQLRIRRKATVSWRGQPRGSRGKPSGPGIRASGCYGVQMDGTRFSRVVVFTASIP